MKIFSVSELRKIIRNYKLEIILTICLFSNLYSDIPSFLYYVLLLSMLFLAQQKKGKYTGERAALAITMLFVIVLSSIVNLSLSMRIPIFIVIFLSTLILNSYQYYLLKRKILRCFMWGFALTVPLNYYAHLVGINYQLYSWIHIGEKFTLDFSGFTVHPMWLSAACGIATIFFVYQMVNIYDKKGLAWSLLMLPLIYASVMVTVWGASRSALGISIGTALLLVYVTNKNISKTFGIVVLISIMGVIALPRFVEGSERMQNKKEVKSITDNSRGALWTARIDEFVSSPLWGIGFSTTGIGEEKKVGRAETGSGWLTVLSQTGLIGFILILLIVKQAILPLRYLRENKEIALFYALFIYMSLHTMFEAYLFQGGWYLCFLYWLIVGVLDDYKKYRRFPVFRIGRQA